MKSLALSLAISLIGFSASANVTGAIGRVKTAVESVQRSQQPASLSRLTSLGGATTTVTIDRAVLGDLDRKADEIEAIAADTNDNVNGVSKKERLDLAVKAMAVLIKNNDQDRDLAKIASGRAFMDTLVGPVNTPLTSANLKKYDSLFSAVLSMDSVSSEKVNAAAIAAGTTGKSDWAANCPE